MNGWQPKVNAEQFRLSHIVRRLEWSRLVRRESDADDGRCTQTVLIRPGSSVLVDAPPGHASPVGSLPANAFDPEGCAAQHGVAVNIVAPVAPAEDHDLAKVRV